MSPQVWCEMAVSPAQFKGLVEFSGSSYRDIAEKVTTALKKDRRHPTIRCSHTVIANLANGKARAIHPRRARAIEQVLKVPPGHLFVMRLSPVSQNDETFTAGVPA